MFIGKCEGKLAGDFKGKIVVLTKGPNAYVIVL